jgi:hypothetical protein
MIAEVLLERELPAVMLREHDLEITVIPSLGGKISSIRWGGRELLARNPYKALQPARYAAPYADYDASGFDECLPTIGPCRYPEHPWRGVELPDHGEFWSLPWTCQEESGGLHLKAHGVRIPYVFEKWIRIERPGVVDLHYSLRNETPFDIRYLWSSHPLLAPQPGMRICLPEDVKVRVDWSKDGRLGELLDEHAWPETVDSRGNPVDLSLILPEQARLVDKLYTTRLSQGWCALYEPVGGAYTAFLFSPREIPYVGLSINLGGWPVDETGEKPGYYNLGLEPCNGYPDRLDIAIQKGDCPTLKAGTSHEWDLQLRVGVAKSMDGARATLSGQSKKLNTEGNHFEP